MQTGGFSDSSEGRWILILSIIASIVNAGKNMYAIRSAAKENDEEMIDYIDNLLDFGVGHIPHIAAMRMGQGTEFDFSIVDSKVIAENRYFGLKRICEAIIDGGTTQKIKFTDIKHDVRKILDVTDDDEATGPGLQEAVEIVLSEVSDRKRARGRSFVREVRCVNCAKCALFLSAL